MKQIKKIIILSFTLLLNCETEQIKDESENINISNCEYVNQDYELIDGVNYIVYYNNNKSSKIVFRYNNITGSFNEGLAPVSINDKWGYIERIDCIK